MLDKYKTLFNGLNAIKEANPNIKFVKIYYIDEENFTIKGIDENGVKCYTKRVCKNKKLKGIDADYRRKTRQ